MDLQHAVAARIEVENSRVVVVVRTLRGRRHGMILAAALICKEEAGDTGWPVLAADNGAAVGMMIHSSLHLLW